MGCGDPSANSLRPPVLNDPDGDLHFGFGHTRRTLVRDESSDCFIAVLQPALHDMSLGDLRLVAPPVAIETHGAGRAASFCDSASARCSAARSKSGRCTMRLRLSCEG